MATLEEQKAEIRKLMAAKRRKLAMQPIDTTPMAAHDIFKNTQKIAGYWPMAGEIDIRPLLNNLSNAGKICGLPVVIQKNTPLIFRQWQPGDHLVEGPHKTLHPQETARRIAPDLIIVPLLAFDEKGGRLGFGGGYYDRTLEHFDGLKVAIAYDEQQVDALPMEPFDQRMDWIVTPTRAIEV